MAQNLGLGELQSFVNVRRLGSIDGIQPLSDSVDTVLIHEFSDGIGVQAAPRLLETSCQPLRSLKYRVWERYRNLHQIMVSPKYDHSNGAAQGCRIARSTRYATGA